MNFKKVLTLPGEFTLTRKVRCRDEYTESDTACQHESPATVNSEDGFKGVLASPKEFTLTGNVGCRDTYDTEADTVCVSPAEVREADDDFGLANLNGEKVRAAEATTKQGVKRPRSQVSLHHNHNEWSTLSF